MKCPICGFELKYSTTSTAPISFYYHCRQCCAYATHSECWFEFNSTDGSLRQNHTNKVFLKVKSSTRKVSQTKIIGGFLIDQP
jgi:hypothetical protein